jgi:lipid-A-disaccharide synthase-like uncharacterized protein
LRFPQKSSSPSCIWRFSLNLGSWLLPAPHAFVRDLLFLLCINCGSMRPQLASLSHP